MGLWKMVVLFWFNGGVMKSYGNYPWENVYITIFNGDFFILINSRFTELSYMTVFLQITIFNGKLMSFRLAIFNGGHNDSPSGSNH